ncbi:hypothetical protein BDY24DRAFT_385896 [Mrakia frigida]|uniref:uncharacterized protein n=1 Tax=Mrakia frigida TaxID=29902 RepID=UPI003FCBFCD0
MDIGRKKPLRSSSSPGRLPFDLYYIIIELNASDPSVPSPTLLRNAVRDDPSHALAAATDFLTRAALVSHLWNEIASFFLYHHVHPLYSGKLERSLELHPYLAKQIHRITSRFDLSFLGRILLSNSVVFPALERFDTLYITTKIVKQRLSLGTPFPNLTTLSILLQQGIFTSRTTPPFLLPPSLVSLSIHADWDCDFKFLLTRNPPYLKSLSLHIFLPRRKKTLELRRFLTPQTARRLSFLQISFWGALESDRLSLNSVVLDSSPNLRTLSIHGVDLDLLLAQTRLPALESIELAHTPSSSTAVNLVSFGWDPQSPKSEVGNAYSDSSSIPAELVRLLDRTRLPLLRTLVVKSLDFSLKSHRHGTLVVLHGFELEKIGIRMVDKSEIGFGEVREGWTWGKVDETKKGENVEEDVEAGEALEMIGGASS